MEREPRAVSQSASEENGPESYSALVANVVNLVERARFGAIRSVNAFLTSTYWLIGQRIVEHEQRGAPRADYGEALVAQLSLDLRGRLGRGFSERNVWQMRQFYLHWPIPETLSVNSDPDSILQTVSLRSLGGTRFPVSSGVDSLRVRLRGRTTRR